MSKVITKAYFYKGKTFTICTNKDGVYMAIDHKHLDKNGKLTQELDGIQMYVDIHNNTLEGIIHRINTYIDFEEASEKRAAELGITLRELTENIELYREFLAEYFHLSPITPEGSEK